MAAVNPASHRNCAKKKSHMIAHPCSNDTRPAHRPGTQLSIRTLNILKNDDAVTQIVRQMQALRETNGHPRSTFSVATYHMPSNMPPFCAAWGHDTIDGSEAPQCPLSPKTTQLINQVLRTHRTRHA